MLVFVCASNLTVPKILSIIADSPEEDFRILTPLAQIKQFFDTLFSGEKTVLFQIPKYSLADYSSLSKTISNYANLKQNIEENKKIVLNEIDLKDNFKLYFELYYFAEFELWLVKELSKKSKETFYMKSISVEPEKAKSFHGKIYKFLNKRLYTTDIIPIISAGLMTGLISEKYLKKIKAKTISVLSNEKTSELIFSKMPELRDKKIILLVGGVVKSKSASEEVYSAIAKELGSAIETAFNEKDVAVKSHPVYIEYYGNENNYSKIDPVIPFNVILNKNIKLVIGFSSAALYEASLQKETIVISTVELFKGKIKEEIFNENKNYLLMNMNASNPIHFPKTIREFSDILKTAA